MPQEKRRVVVTGLGAFTPVGKNAETTYGTLLRGENGIHPITSFDTSGFASTIAAEIDFDPLDHFDRREVRHLDRMALVGIIACKESFEHAGLAGEPENVRQRIAVIMGVGGVGFHSIEHEIAVLNAKGEHGVSPFALLKFQPESFTGEFCRRFGLRGLNCTVNSACSSGLDALVSAYEKILLGKADIVITGGAGAEVTPLGLSTFGRMRALSTNNDDPSHASRPFSKERDGFVLGEGEVAMIALAECQGLYWFCTRI